MEQTPFHIATMFDDIDDFVWAWNLLLRGVCDKHAPPKEIKARSVSSLWSNNSVRLKMNRRFKVIQACRSIKISKQLDRL